MRILLVSIIVGLSLFIVASTHGQQFSPSNGEANEFVSIQPFLPITPKASPTPTTPLEEIPVGFCLSIPILTYHHIENREVSQKENRSSLGVDPTMFEEQLRYLKDHGYTSIKAETLFEALRAKTQISGKPVVITLDDGYSDMYDHAFSIANRYGIILNLMIPTGLMENPGYLTWSQLRQMVSMGHAAYNHTWSHFALGSGDRSKIQTEISVAEQQLRDNVRPFPKIITYPYGSYNQEVINIVQNELGYIGGFSTRYGRLACDSMIMTLPRLSIGNAPLSQYGL